MFFHRWKIKCTMSFPITCGLVMSCQATQFKLKERTICKALHTWILSDSLFAPHEEFALIQQWAHQMPAPFLCSEPLFWKLQKDHWRMPGALFFRDPWHFRSKSWKWCQRYPKIGSGLSRQEVTRTAVPPSLSFWFYVCVASVPPENDYGSRRLFSWACLPTSVCLVLSNQSSNRTHLHMETKP